MKFSDFFVMQKDYHERFFGFFVFFTWVLQCLRLFDGLWYVDEVYAIYSRYFWIEFSEKNA